MNKLLGLGLIIGATAVVSFIYKTVKEHVEEETMRVEQRQSTESRIAIKEVERKQENIAYEHTKNKTGNAIFNRHNEAQAVMQESIGNILKNSSVEKNVDAHIDRVTKELDEMLLED